MANSNLHIVWNLAVINCGGEALTSGNYSCAAAGISENSTFSQTIAATYIYI